jgi:YD repeat-containing protein
MPLSFSNQALRNAKISTSDNRLTSTGWTYDSAGNTIRDPDGRTFIYDAEIKQVEVNNSSNASIGTYFFDGDGKRVKKVVPSWSSQ